MTKKQLEGLKLLLEPVVKKHHKRNIEKVISKIIKRASTLKNSLNTRSKKYNVECNVTLEELRNLIISNYGNKCKYCDKILTVNTMVIDHIIPISKGGSSNIDNLQLICKTSNSMKGSLSEDHFNILLSWLENDAPKELANDVKIRLSRGII